MLPYILVGLLSIPFVTLLRALALIKLWGWFLIPLGAPHISWVPAMGLSVIFSLLATGATGVSSGDSKNDKRSDKEKKDAFAQAIGLAYLTPLAALAAGWAIHLFA